LASDSAVMFLTFFSRSGILSGAAALAILGAGCTASFSQPGMQVGKMSFLASKPAPNPVAPAASLTIAAVGDMMLGSPFPNDSRMPPNDGKDLLSPAASLLSSADIAFGNLEGPLADGGISEKCGTGRDRCFAFRMPTRFGQHFKSAGFDVLSVANNHASDFGPAGRRSTRETLDRLGIKHAGSDSGSYSTAYLTVRGIKVAFVAFATNSVSLNLNSLASARSAVSLAGKQADIVVVSFHGGAEGPAARHVPRGPEIFLREKRGNLRAFSRAVIDAGADLVIGHGPHVVRGMEIYKGRLVAYSLGNFLTYGWFRLEGATAESLVLTVDLGPKGEFVAAKIHPFRLESWGFLKVDESGSAISTIRSLSSQDFGAGAPMIAADGTITGK